MKTLDIAEERVRAMAEGERGFQWFGWDEMSLVSVREAVAKVTVTPASSRKAA
jgi:hypothetical protein